MATLPNYPLSSHESQGDYMDIEIDEPFITKNFIAHKGLHDHETPENSLSAFKKAIENNYIIECDVQLIADGTVVVFGGDQLSRMTGRDGYIKNLTKAQLEDYKLLNTDECIPTLEEVLQLVDGKVGILIDLKDNQSRIGQLEKAVCKLVRNYKGDVAIQSFNPLSLEWFAKYSPNILRGQIACTFRGKEFKHISRFRRRVLRHMKLNNRAKPNFISYNASELPSRYLKKVSNLPIIGWTVKSQEEYRNCFNFVDNIIFEGFEPKVVPANKKEIIQNVEVEPEISTADVNVNELAS